LRLDARAHPLDVLRGGLCSAATVYAASTSQLKQLSLEQLMDVEVMSVSKVEESLGVRPPPSRLSATRIFGARAPPAFQKRCAMCRVCT